MLCPAEKHPGIYYICLGDDIVSTSKEILEKFIRELMIFNEYHGRLRNRNPTINYGGILRCRCTGINMNYTMSISLLILKPLAADFDGDTLNIMYLYNGDFIRLTNDIFNPIQLYISRNDGQCNSDMLPSRDMLINANGLKSMCKYTLDEVNEINNCMICE